MRERSMEPTIKIVAAERVRGGVMVEFSDGRLAVFPATLLWELVPGFEVKNPFEEEEE